MGFACGLPLPLTLDLLKAWMKTAGVDLTLIGLASLVGLPYTLKFFWAPVFDRFTLPWLGRRRGWLLAVQIALILAVAAMALTRPDRTPVLGVMTAVLVAFFSASQDIVVDAYRREDLPDEHLGLGSSLYVNGYRLAMLLAGGGGLMLADHFSFQAVYLTMAAGLLIGVLTTLAVREPACPKGTPTSFKEAVIAPLADYFRRDQALWVLAFILLYKIGDTMAAAMTMPFYLDIGFSKTQVGAIVKLFGFWSTVAGGLLGGLVMVRLSIYSSLWVFGVLQAVSTAGFAVLAAVGPRLGVLAVVIGFENFTAGLGTTAFVAFMASITNKKFTATQYALLSSLMGIPRVLVAAPTGYLAKQMGWEAFFIACTLMALPGLALLLGFSRRNQPDGINAPHQ
jgi:PAT family beta-lactamase induction signal transducer AmpG